MATINITVKAETPEALDELVAALLAQTENDGIALIGCTVDGHEAL